MLFDALSVKLGPKLDASPKAASYFGVYVSDDGTPVALCGCDMAFAANSGAALSMLPPNVAKEAAKDKELTPVMLANLHEVMNICTRLMLRDDSPHLKLRELCVGAMRCCRPRRPKFIAAQRARGSTSKLASASTDPECCRSCASSRGRQRRGTFLATAVKPIREADSVFRSEFFDRQTVKGLTAVHSSAMTFKMKIWSIPISAVAVFGLTLALTFVLSTRTARTITDLGVGPLSAVMDLSQRLDRQLKLIVDGPAVRRDGRRRAKANWPTVERLGRAISQGHRYSVRVAGRSRRRQESAVDLRRVLRFRRAGLQNAFWTARTGDASRGDCAKMQARHNTPAWKRLSRPQTPRLATASRQALEAGNSGVRRDRVGDRGRCAAGHRRVSHCCRR